MERVQLFEFEDLPWFPQVVRECMTDFLSFLGQRSGSVEFRGQPVDATAVPESLPGFRLICNAFHHLPPSAARKCLADAVSQRRGIALVELVDRSAAGLFSVTVGTSTMLAVTPFIRPVRVSRLVLTYLLPVVPLCTWWDGMVSCLRAYTPDELESLVAGLPENDYVWDIGRLPVPNA